MTELARPRNVFLAEAKETALQVASALLRSEGWRAEPSAVREWRERIAVLNPAAPNAGEEYYQLLRRYWQWSGKCEKTDAEER